ncbi:MAG: PQQ-binding-like beta-propeller repeat protein [Chloroflexi bacterium]|nr:PQQ-binding-like beta-propeller repeat protein [Chloroflexota bacterium]
MLKALNCPSCHASLDLPETLTQPTIKCPYCNTTAIVPEELRHSGKGLAATTDADKILEEVLQLILNDEKIEAIKRYREFFRVDLKTAKDSVEALEMGWSEQAAVGVNINPSVQKSAGCAGGFFVFIALLVLVIGGAGAFLYLMAAPTESTISEAISIISQEVGQGAIVPSNVRLNGPELLLPVGDGRLADVAYTSRDFDEETMWVSYFDGAAGVTRWRSASFADKLGAQSLYADEQYIYYISDNKLTALNRSDGRTVWQTTLSDRLPYTCTNTCILSFGDRLVVQTLDNKLHGLNSATGEVVWDTGLDLSSPRGLWRVGEWTAVLTDNADNGGGLDLFEPANGRLAQRIEPRCDHPNFSDQEPSFTDPILVDETDQSVYFIFGFFNPLCIQKWNYATNTQAWNTFIDKGLPPSDAVFTQDANNLYYNTGDRQVVAAAKSDGAVRPLIEDAAYYLLPQTTRSNVLLVKTIRSVGSRREELWGVDVSSGGALWKFVPQADKEMAVGSLDVVHASSPGYWTAQPSLSGVRLLQARQDPTRLVLETLGLRDGASSGQKSCPSWLRLPRPIGFRSLAGMVMWPG